MVNVQLYIYVGHIQHIPYLSDNLGGGERLRTANLLLATSVSSKFLCSPDQNSEYLNVTIN